MKAIDFVMGFIRDFLTHRANAIRTVEEIRRGEWIPQYHPRLREHLTAYRGNCELWLGNGPFFTEILVEHSPGNYLSSKDTQLGLFWRHYVWHKAARQLKVYADRYVNSTI